MQDYELRQSFSSLGLDSKLLALIKANGQPMSGETTARLAPTDSRYRALLEVSTAIVEQPTVKAVLHSCAAFCPAVAAFTEDLWVLGSDGENLHVLEFDREADAPTIKIGLSISRIGAVAQVLEDQEPVFIPDISREMLKHPALVPFAANLLVDLPMSFQCPPHTDDMEFSYN